MQILKQSTAVDVLIGPFLDLTDAASAETGESPSVKLSKNGQALAAKNDITTPVHDADGFYNCELDATDTNTVGTLVLSVAKSANALPIRHEYQVVEEAIYDAMFGASAAGFDANGRVDVGSWLGTAVTTSSTTSLPEVDTKSISDDATAANNAEAFFDGTGYAGTNNVIPTVTAVTNGVTLANGAVTDASLAGNMEIVFETDFATNYNATRNAWATNVQDFVGTSAADPFNGQVVAASVTAEVQADVAKISTSAAAANNLEASALGIITGAAVTGTLNTTTATTDLTGYANDQLIGRTLIVTSGNADGEATDITDYANTNGTLTFTALTTAMGNGDTFVIV